MANKTDTATQLRLDTPEPREPWFAQGADRVVAAMETDAERGLSRSEAGARLSRYGPNQIAAEKPPSLWAVALQQLRDPMTHPSESRQGLSDHPCRSGYDAGGRRGHANRPGCSVLDAVLDDNRDRCFADRRRLLSRHGTPDIQRGQQLFVADLREQSRNAVRRLRQRRPHHIHKRRYELRVRSGQHVRLLFWLYWPHSHLRGRRSRTRCARPGWHPGRWGAGRAATVGVGPGGVG